MYVIKMLLADDVFSIGIGLDCAGIVGPIHWLWKSGSSTKTRNKRDRHGSPGASPMLKSVLFDEREDQLLRE